MATFSPPVLTLIPCLPMQLYQLALGPYIFGSETCVTWAFCGWHWLKPDTRSSGFIGWFYHCFLLLHPHKCMGPSTVLVVWVVNQVAGLPSKMLSSLQGPGFHESCATDRSTNDFLNTCITLLKWWGQVEPPEVPWLTSLCYFQKNDHLIHLNREFISAFNDGTSSCFIGMA